MPIIFLVFNIFWPSWSSIFFDHPINLPIIFRVRTKQNYPHLTKIHNCLLNRLSLDI
jgi:hypothetical protein